MLLKKVLGFCSMLIDMCLLKFDIYQSTVASNCFKSHVKSRYSDFFQTKLLSNVRSEIQLVRVTSVLPDNLSAH